MAKEERMRTMKRNGKSESKQKLLTLASRDNDIKMDVLFFVILKYAKGPQN